MPAIDRPFAMRVATAFLPTMLQVMEDDHCLRIATPEILPYCPSRDAWGSKDAPHGFFVPMGVAGRVRINVEENLGVSGTVGVLSHELGHAAMYQGNGRYKHLYAEPGELYDALDEGVAVHLEAAALRSLSMRGFAPTYARVADDAERWARNAGRRNRTYRVGYEAVRSLKRDGWTLARIVRDQEQALAQVLPLLKKAGLDRR